MDEKIKLLANKTVDAVYRRVRRASKSDFLKFNNNVGLGADGTITKYVDKIAEEAALNVINKSKTRVNVLSEEIGFVDNNAEYTFVLDPLDGTRNAARGIPFYSVSLAVGKKRISDVEYGIVKNIPTGDVFVAEKGFGAFYNNKRIYVPDVPDKELLSSLALGKNFDETTISLARKDKVRSLGSASLEMCMVAIGGLDFYVIGKEYLRCVDIAASTLILREAGGVVTNIHGEELDMPFDLNEHTSVVAACSIDVIRKIIS
ncbi:MAG: inositol monophosphatase [Thermoplasmata archaeon]|nr:MAG: inositol monophosphatase [Thermoplasmata archaeon]